MRMGRDHRGRFVTLDPYDDCPVFEQHGACRCSTGVGFGCSKVVRRAAPDEGDEGR